MVISVCLQAHTFVASDWRLALARAHLIVTASEFRMRGSTRELESTHLLVMVLLLWYFLELIMLFRSDGQEVVFLGQFVCKGRNLEIPHSNEDHAICLEARYVEVNRGTTANFFGQ